MFNRARIKLTAWYLFIIMGISITFSMVIARAVTLEVERFERMQRVRIQSRLENRFFPPPGSETPQINQFRILMENPELMEETKRRVFLMLGLINFGIFVVSGGLGYMLAGRTLAPIRDMVDDQNRFVSDASHELRTPLAAMKTSMEVSLRDKNLTLDGARKIIMESIEDVNKLQTLSENLLQLAQYQKQNGEASFETVSFAEAVREAVRKMEPLAKKKKITIKTQILPLFVKGNPFGLVDIGVILLDNAIKYSHPRGTITVVLDKRDKYARLKIIDQGIGISKTDLPHIFDRFFRADTARTKSSGGGYGLGLSIAKKITDMHKGCIYAESSQGKGTVFTVLVPVIRKN